MDERQSDIARARRALQTHRYRCVDEAELQAAIEKLLSEAGVPFEREVSLSERDRADFQIAGGHVLEVKVDGANSEVLRQLLRYAEHEAVRSVTLATTRRRHLGLPGQVLGKPLIVITLEGGVFA